MSSYVTIGILYAQTVFVKESYAIHSFTIGILFRLSLERVFKFSPNLYFELSLFINIHMHPNAKKGFKLIAI